MLLLHLRPFHHPAAVYPFYPVSSPRTEAVLHTDAEKSQRNGLSSLLFSSSCLYVICKHFYNEILLEKDRHTSKTRLVFILENGVCWHFLVLVSRRHQGTSLSHAQLVPANTPNPHPQFLGAEGGRGQVSSLIHPPLLKEGCASALC